MESVEIPLSAAESGRDGHELDRPEVTRRTKTVTAAVHVARSVGHSTSQKCFALRPPLAFSPRAARAEAATHCSSPR